MYIYIYIYIYIFLLVYGSEIPMMSNMKVFDSLNKICWQKDRIGQRIF